MGNGLVVRTVARLRKNERVEDPRSALSHLCSAELRTSRDLSSSIVYSRAKLQYRQFHTFVAHFLHVFTSVGVGEQDSDSGVIGWLPTISIDLRRQPPSLRDHLLARSPTPTCLWSDGKPIVISRRFPQQDHSHSVRL